MRLWTAIKRAFGCMDYELIVDHVPVSGDKDYRKKLAKARERHGRAFHSHTPKPRETPPSHDLQQFNQANQASKKPDATVTKIKAAK